MPSIDELKLYADICDKTKTNLLLGNGISIGVGEAFSYSSLRTVATENNFLKKDDNQLFNALNTSDFEAVMRRLKEASEVNRLLGLTHKFLDTKYDSIKNALISTVRLVHPRYDEVDYQWMRAVAAELIAFERIFTTNYDLLLYWILGSEDFEGFTDFFWSDRLRFDPFNTDKRSDRREVYYLHGALFMFSLGRTIHKIERSRVNSLLDHIGGKIFLSRELPVFVSEGRFGEKMNAINRNPYLNFALRSFNSIHSGLTVYGHSLNEDADKHIIHSINNNATLTALAISIYAPHSRSSEDIEAEMEQYKRKLKPFLTKGGQLEFFRSDSSPFYYEAAEVVSSRKRELHGSVTWRPVPATLDSSIRKSFTEEDLPF